MNRLSQSTDKHANGSTLKSTEKSIITVLSRAFRLRCPACGEASIAAKAFRIRHDCPNCRTIFKREEGFFVGAILGNVLTTEAVILIVCGFCLVIIGSSYDSVLPVLFVVGLVFPVLFYHHSWSLWLAFDHLIEGLPKVDQ